MNKTFIVTIWMKARTYTVVANNQTAAKKKAYARHGRKTIASQIAKGQTEIYEPVYRPL